MFSVMCGSLTLRRNLAHPQISQSICHTPLNSLLESDHSCMRVPTSFKAVTQSVSSQMPQCTHLFLQRTPMRTRTPPACPLTWVMAARWWMVSCMCTRRGTLWKSEIFMMNHSVHACFILQSSMWRDANRRIVSCLSFYVAYRSTELDLLYPDLQEYIADMNVMMALIINGPVQVHQNRIQNSVYIMHLRFNFEL